MLRCDEIMDDGTTRKPKVPTQSRKALPRLCLTAERRCADGHREAKTTVCQTATPLSSILCQYPLPVPAASNGRRTPDIGTGPNYRTKPPRNRVRMHVRTGRKQRRASRVS